MKTTAITRMNWFWNQLKKAVYNLAGYDCGFSIKDCDSLEALEDLLLSNDPKDFICDDARGALKKNLHTNLHPLFKQK